MLKEDVRTHWALKAEDAKYGIETPPVPELGIYGESQSFALQLLEEPPPPPGTNGGGGVLVFLYPPDQDVIGIAGMGSDDSMQHLSLILVILSLAGPIFCGFLFFYEEFSTDSFIFIWVLASFAAPSLGLTVAMLERSKAIAEDLMEYFETHQILDMASLEWLHGLGPRTATYRMGMLENSAKRVSGLRIVGHQIIKENTTVSINQ